MYKSLLVQHGEGNPHLLNSISTTFKNCVGGAAIAHEKVTIMPKQHIFLHITLIFVFALLSAFTVSAQSTSTSTNTCEVVRYLMANNITPYDMDLGGGQIGDNVPVAGEMPVNHYADFWSFTVTREARTPVITTIHFENASDNLEFALFRGMLPELGFMPLADTEFTFDRDDTYTIVVRRTDLLDNTVLEYTLSLITESLGQINPPEILDLSNASGQGAAPPAEFDGGQLTIQMPIANINAHADAINLVNTREGASTQVYFPDLNETNTAAFTLHVEDWAQDIRFLAGDMALTGRDRIYFLENFGYAGRLDGGRDGSLDLLDITYADQTQIIVNWDIIQGIWVLDKCAGFKLTDGRTFIGEIGEIDNTKRSVTFNGNLDSFTIEFAPPLSDTEDSNVSNSANIRYQAQFNWAEIQPESEIAYKGDVFNFPLTNNRQLTLQSTNIQLASTDKTDVIMDDIEVTLTLDWTNMAAFALQDGAIRVNFTDNPRSSATFERSAINLQKFEALNDIISIKYNPDMSIVPQGSRSVPPGEERILFPASDGYIEIVTPQGYPTFDGQAMPNQSGYIPRALNNTGIDCYPVNTILPEANCPLNGELNPANGNLFYAVEDMSTYDSDLNLDFTRSYNSRLTHFDGSFGSGWTTPFQLDYNIPFSQATGSRQITSDYVYRVGLDVTWAPRGLVTFITPTGSQHQFVNDEPAYESGTLTAVTMPGWTLYRETPTSEIWTLQQLDGLTYVFDRVGRLLHYTNGVKTITITYPRHTLSGANASMDGVVISDGSGRQIKIEYNDDGHIVRSVLSNSDATHELVSEYTYTDGFLTGVTYPNGTKATYVYDETGHLIEHNDPRAPIYPHMRYSYDAEENVETVRLVTETGDEIPHRFYSVVADENSSKRQATVIDENNNRREYTYRHNEGELKAPADTFTLISISNPLTEVNETENRAQLYEYKQGLMVRTRGEALTDGKGRGSISYEYNKFGQIQCIACISSSQSVPSLEVVYQPDPNSNDVLPRPIEIHYANGTTESFAYDENEQLVTYTDTKSAIYTYVWEAGRIVTTLRQQDEERVDYAYNETGQVESETHTLGDSSYQIHYEYDWLGRITEIQDSVLGHYSITHHSNESGTTITATDPIDIRSTYQYDNRDRLVETSVEGDTLLSLTTYAYDIYDHLTEETQWLIDDTSGIPITTTYLYERRPTIPPLATDDPITAINGTQITMSDPELGEHLYSFDALGRIRRVEDPFQRTYYDYLISQNTNYWQGLLIRQRTLINGTSQPDTIDYIFDSKYQLREVRSEKQQWKIEVDGENPILQSSIQAQTDGRISGLQSALWSNYTNGVPASVGIRHGDLPLQSRFSVLNDHRPTNTLELDFEGRPTAIINGADDILYIVYCPVENGSIQEIYARNIDATCDTTDYDVSMTYDISGRLLEAIDETGTRTFIYTPQPDNHTWQVEIIFSNTEINSFTWNMTYDGLGHLIKWKDADGFEHLYTYDTLGRLTSTSIPDQPENSFTFRYNDANLVVEEIDNLGRGFLYEYNELGQVIVRLDKATADSISYTYTPNGQLSTIITSDGNITTYLYQDTVNPNRLTGIIEPTGGQHKFTWNDQNNTLIYTDPLQHITIYYYDGNGLLWRINDSLNIISNEVRTSEFLYDDAGQINSLLFDVRPNSVQSDFTLDRSTNNEIKIHEKSTNWASNFSFAPSGELLGIDGLSATYDPLGRLASVNFNENSWILTRTDGNPLISLVDGYGNAIELYYDSLFRLITETRGGEVINVDYSDQFVTITLPDGTVNNYVFLPGDVQKGEAPSVTRLGNGFRIRYLYDMNGLLTQLHTEVCSNPTETDTNTCAIQTKSVTFTYDGAGRPVSLIDENGNFETFTYDRVGNIITYRTKNGQQYNYKYDEGSRLLYISTTSGVKLILEQNTLDRVTGICRTQIEAPDDYISCVDMGGVIESYQYDALGRMTQRTYNPGSDNEKVLNYRYTFETTGALADISLEDVNTSFSYTDLGRIADIRTESSNVSFTYDTFGRVISPEDTTYSYDALNQLVVAGNLSYDFTPTQLNLTDTLTGKTIAYATNERGNLDSINGDTLKFEYPTLTNTNINRSDGVTIQQELNLSGEVQSIIYEGQLSYIHQTDPIGYVRRQIINMPSLDKGYSITIGYDNDNRPLAMSIANIQNLRILYTQTFSYNDTGLLIQETRQYQDNIKAIINYEYANNTQLARQLIRIVRPVESIAFTLDYNYGITGNLESIIQTLSGDSNTRIECARYDYDSINRLTRVRLTNVPGDESQITYSYDTFNRLITAGNYALTYDGERLFSVSDGIQTQYFGGPIDQPPYFTVDENDNITWLYHDGQQRIVAAIPDGSEFDTVWLFDPLNRYISLENPLSDIDACQLSSIPNGIPEYLAIQPHGDKMLWDVRSNLYITEGRAYDPEQARYLQRDLLGPDVFGYLYEDFNGRNELPLMPYKPTYNIGLNVLHEAETNIALNTALSAEAITQRFTMTTPNNSHPLATSLTTTRIPYNDSMQQMVNLPRWLQMQYNLPASSYDMQTGALTMPTETSVAMGGTGQTFTPYSIDMLPNWSDHQIGTHLNHIPEVNPLPQPFRTYIPWTVDTLSYQEIHTLPLVPINHAPNDVWTWLPKTLESPTNAVAMLDFAELVTQMPYQPRYVWIDGLLEQAFPNEADLPSGSSDEWLANWFTNDIFRLNGSILLPNNPEIPISPAIGMKAEVHPK